MADRMLVKGIAASLALLLFAGIDNRLIAEAADPDEWTRSGSIAPRANADERFASPLRVVTLVTDDLSFARHFLVNGWGLEFTGPVPLDETTRAIYTEAFDLTDLGRWAMYYAHRPRTADEVAIRIVHGEKSTPRIREQMNARTDGILAVGNAIANVAVHEPLMRRLGIGSVAGVQELVLPQDGGGVYTVKEIHYEGPESSYFLGIDRPESLAPVSQIDEGIGLGGPTYSSTMAADPTLMSSFLQAVLGYEVRRDLSFKTGGKDGGLHLTPGSNIRFIQLFAPGAAAGWIIVMGAGEDRIAPKASPRPPHRGLAAWTFTVPDLGAAERRLRAEGTAFYGPVAITDPVLGTRRLITTIAPNGQLIELIETGGDPVRFAEVQAAETCDQPVIMLVEGKNDNAEQFAAYGNALRDSGLYPKHSGYYVALGDPDLVFEGVWQEAEFRVIARFPCHRKAREFWYSEHYQSIAKFREGAGDVRATVFPEVSARDAQQTHRRDTESGRN